MGSNIKISNFQQMQALEYNWKLIILLNVIWYSDEQRPKTPILKIIKDENSIVALGLQKSFKRFISYRKWKMDSSYEEAGFGFEGPRCWTNRECYLNESCVAQMTEDDYIPCTYPLNRSPLHYKCLCKVLV